MSELSKTLVHLFRLWWFSGQVSTETMDRLQWLASEEPDIYEIFMHDEAFLSNPFELDRPAKARIWTANDTQRYQVFYEELFENADEKELGVLCGYDNDQVQEQILGDLIQIDHLEGCSVLDFGCGPGSLLSLLKKQKIAIDHYVGVEIGEEMLNLGKKMNPEAEFIQGDCFSLDSEVFQTLHDRKFDFVFVSGMFGLRPDNWSEAEFNGLVLDLVAKYFQYAKKGLALSFIPLSVLEPEPTKNYEFHTFDRMAFATSLKKLNCEISTLDGFEYDGFRLLMQTPLFLTRQKFS